MDGFNSDYGDGFNSDYGDGFNSDYDDSGHTRDFMSQPPAFTASGAYTSVSASPYAFLSLTNPPPRQLGFDSLDLNAGQSWGTCPRTRASCSPRMKTAEPTRIPPPSRTRACPQRQGYPRPARPSQWRSPRGRSPASRCLCRWFKRARCTSPPGRGSRHGQRPSP
jgi:hypothetical protein